MHDGNERPATRTNTSSKVPGPIVRFPPQTMLKQQLVLVVVAASVALASAHFRLNLPVPRSPSDNLKTIPCGKVEAGASGVRTVVTGGSQMTVEVQETVLHPGYYTVAYSVLNDNNFSEHELLGDNLFPKDTIAGSTQGEIKSTTVTIPNAKCETCTIQVRQYMAETRTYYYSCADIEIDGPVVPCATNSTGAQCSGSDSGTCMAGYCVCNDGFYGEACESYDPGNVGGRKEETKPNQSAEQTVVIALGVSAGVAVIAGLGFAALRNGMLPGAGAGAVGDDDAAAAAKGKEEKPMATISDRATGASVLTAASYVSAKSAGGASGVGGGTRRKRSGSRPRSRGSRGNGAGRTASAGKRSAGAAGDTAGSSAGAAGDTAGSSAGAAGGTAGSSQDARKPRARSRGSRGSRGGSAGGNSSGQRRQRSRGTSASQV